MLCPFCKGAGHHSYLRQERLAWWFCQPCKGTGVKTPQGPAELRLGQAQTKFLKPLPEIP